MSPASACLRLDRWRKLTVLRLQFRERPISAIPRIDVQHDKPGICPGDDSDVGLRPRLPPPSNLVCVCGRVLEPVGGPRVFANAAAVGTDAGATGKFFAPNGAMHREDRPATFRTGQCLIEQTAMIRCIE